MNMRFKSIEEKREYFLERTTTNTINNSSNNTFSNTNIKAALPLSLPQSSSFQQKSSSSVSTSFESSSSNTASRNIHSGNYTSNLSCTTKKGHNYDQMYDDSTDIKFEQKILITNKNANKTNIIMFHAFQEILTTTDGYNISMWSLHNSNRILHWNNQNYRQQRGNSMYSIYTTPLVAPTPVPVPGPVVHTHSNSSLVNNSGLTSSSLPRSLSLLSLTRASSGGNINTTASALLNNSTTGQIGGGSSHTTNSTTAYNSNTMQYTSRSNTPVESVTSAVVPVAMSEARITTMSWINESYDALLLVRACIMHECAYIHTLLLVVRICVFMGFFVRCNMALRVI